MSTPLFMAFVFMTMCAAILDGFMAGNVGIATTTLTSELSADATTANVNDANGFPNRGVIQIESELLCYSGTTSTTFTGLLRGKRCGSNAKVSSTVSLHPVGNRVYAEGAGLFNTILSFDVAHSFSQGGFTGALLGVVSMIRLAPEFIAVLARMVLWDFDFLSGPYVYIRYIVLGGFTSGLVLGGIKLVLGR